MEILRNHPGVRRWPTKPISGRDDRDRRARAGRQAKRGVRDRRVIRDGLDLKVRAARSDPKARQANQASRDRKACGARPVRRASPASGARPVRAVNPVRPDNFRRSSR